MFGWAVLIANIVAGFVPRALLVVATRRRLARERAEFEDFCWYVEGGAPWPGGGYFIP